MAGNKVEVSSVIIGAQNLLFLTVIWAVERIVEGGGGVLYATQCWHG